MEHTDIKFLKTKMQLRIIEEEYERAAKMKKWIIELGGDPTLQNDNTQNTAKQKRDC